MKNATCKMLVKLTPGRLLQEVQQRVQRVRTVDGFKSIRYVLFQMLFYIFLSKYFSHISKSIQINRNKYFQFTQKKNIG